VPPGRDADAIAIMWPKPIVATSIIVGYMSAAGPRI